jgi:DNA-binding MarR family transcriptional regulator
MPAPAHPPAETPPLQPIQCACTALKRAARIVGRAYDAGLSPVGVSVTQYAILANVRRYEPISQMRLATHLGLERTTLYRTVESLENRGWLTATQTGEGVTKVLALTPAGTQVLARARRVWAQVQQGFEHAFGATRWGTFLATLDEIQAYFEGQLEAEPLASAPRPRESRRQRGTRRRQEAP